MAQVGEALRPTGSCLGSWVKLVIIGLVTTAVHFAACLTSLSLFGEIGGTILMQWWVGAGWLPQHDQWQGLIPLGLTMPILPLVYLSMSYGISVSLELQAACLLINSGLWGVFATFAYWCWSSIRCETVAPRTESGRALVPRPAVSATAIES